MIRATSACGSRVMRGRGRRKRAARRPRSEQGDRARATRGFAGYAPFAQGWICVPGSTPSGLQFSGGMRIVIGT
ncbi:MAG TPA: hypothetical protein VK081_05105 [Planctomycetota bacterium]|nr:hypothetical protein [Planctomycetota bacterium]